MRIKSRRNKQLRQLAFCSLVVTPAIVRADPPSGDNFRLVFSDDFVGNSLDTSKWTTGVTWTMPNSNSSNTPANVSVGNGMLTLTSNRPTSAASFNSGAVSTYGLYQFTGGYAEAKIYLPTTVGSWPAFWGLYTGWPPETDIMEYPLTTNGGTDGYESNQYSTNYHYVNSSGVDAAGAGVVSASSALDAGWHTFAVDWVTNTSMTFYLDGTQVQSYSGSSVSQMADMYLILDYAVGGWPGTPSTTQWPVGHSDQMLVSDVRVWQSNPNSDAPSDWNISGGGSFTTAGNWTKGVPAYGNETAYFGRVGTASTAAITTGSWQLFGGITFDGLASGTTAYTLGSSGTNIQLAALNTAGTVTIQATAASTANQTINSNIEFVSNAEIQNNMTGGQLLTINGNLSGAGAVNVDGVGTLVLAGTGSYTGATTIGTSQGPATVLAEGNSALGTGAVTIGAQGNTTTAKLELAGGITLPNAISLSGRNNTSVGIENISGNNILSGTISSGVGGGNYEIQSDAGTLTLSGSNGSGIAIESGATGARTITLQGAGNGLVSGKIANGSATVSLIQAGPGTWALSAADTYTGTTTISGGSLQLLGSGAPTAAYSFSPGTVSGTTVTNTGLGGASLNATFNANGGTGSVATTGGPLAGTGALVLNGNGSTLDVNSGITSFANNSSWTISTWVKTTQAGFSILNKGTPGSNWSNSNSTFYLGVQGQNGSASGGVPVAVRWAGGWLSGTTSPQVDNGTWQMVTYTDNGTTETVYVDGVAETTTQGFGNGDIGTHVRFGIGGAGESDGNAVSSGSIGAINIYSNALTAAQIQALYTSNVASVLTTNILPSTTPVSLTSSSAVFDLESVNQTVASVTGPTGSSIILGLGSNLKIASTASDEFDGSVTGNGGITLATAEPFTLGGSNVSYTGSTSIASGATLNLPASNTSGSIVVRSIGAATIASSGRITLAPAASQSTRQVLVIPSLAIASNAGYWFGTLDLANNDMVVRGAGPGGLATLTSEVGQGYASGTWQGGGIVSSSAANQSSHLTAIGIIQNDNGAGAPLYTTFDGITVSDSDVLAKYTYYGDTNLNGEVDAADYSRIDNAYLGNLNSPGSHTGWFNGDFNYDGVIDGSDYALIDNSFNTQGASLTAESASVSAQATAQIAGSAVPEPTAVGLLAIAGLGLLGRRQRRGMRSA